MPGAGDGEQRHRLGEPVDRGPPLLAQQQQDGRDQRAGVADADPPDEVDDREAPADRHVDAPDADALDEQLGDARSGSIISSTKAMPKPTNHHVGVGAVRTTRADLVGDRRRACGRARRPAARTASPAMAVSSRWPCRRFRRSCSRRSSASSRVRVAQLGQVGGARPGVRAPRAARS